MKSQSNYYALLKPTNRGETIARNRGETITGINSNDPARSKDVNGQDTTMRKTDTRESDTISTPENKEAVDTTAIQSGFIPDTTINHLLRLEDYASLHAFYENIARVKVREGIRNSPVVLFKNEKGTEYLVAYVYEGDTKNAYACFEMTADKKLTKFAPLVTKHRSFATESGLHLGMSLHEIEKKKGTGYSKKVAANGDLTITYHFSGMNKVPFLKRYAMPGYFMEITLTADKASKIVFGFDYP